MTIAHNSANSAHVQTTGGRSLVEFGSTPHHQIKEMDSDHRDIAASLKRMQQAFDRGSQDVHLCKNYAHMILDVICGHFYREAKDDKKRL